MMRKLNGWVLGLALLFGAALVYQTAGLAAEITPGTDQKVEKKVEKKVERKKLKPSVKKKAVKHAKADATALAPVTPSGSTKP